MTVESSPERYNPSAEWTQEERIKVALDILDEMQKAARAGKWANPMMLGDYSTRLALLLAAPVGFLEDNREHVIKGDFTLPKP